MKVQFKKVKKKSEGVYLVKFLFKFDRTNPITCENIQMTLVIRVLH